MGEKINHPKHYTHGSIECIEAIEAAVHGLRGMEVFYIGIIFKYLWRWRYKNGVEDLEKARWYLDKLLAAASEKETD